ncbi:MAG: hypothetical protein HKN28_19140 [Alphaproteobacteria bacterium]|nr:hypothetical protein [Alphaproteobacteria bacterium]
MTKRKKPTPLKSSYALSRYNALSYGAYSDKALLPWEDESEYNALYADLVADYSPEGVTETRAVRKMADAEWRQRRLRGAERGAAQKALRRTVQDYLKPRGSGPGSVVAQLFERDGSDEDELVGLVSMPPDQAQAALHDVEADLQAVSVAKRAFIKTRDIDSVLAALPEKICQAYAAKICDHGLDPSKNTTPDEDVADGYASESNIRSAALEYLLDVCQIQLQRKRAVLQHYREIHAAAQLDAVENTSGNISQRERDLDRSYKDGFISILNVKKFKSLAVAVKIE